jgi:hypothetical protein
MRSGSHTRRSFIAGLAATAGLAIAGCGQARTPDTRTKGSSQPATAASAQMTVYRDPSCGCCEAWAGIARRAGFQVKVIDHADMPVIKTRYGVPDHLRSCHTTVVGGYAIEGHVPLEDVLRLLKEKPAKIRGIAVAGMPLGSPGMEVPDGTTQPFRVMAFDKRGGTSVFRG